MRRLVGCLMVVMLLAVPQLGHAAGATGTVTQVLSLVTPLEVQSYSTSVNKPQWGYGDLRYVTVSWVGGTGDYAGVVPNTDIYWDFDGYILQVIVDPGTTAPTTLYDITLVNDQGADVMGGGLADLSATATELRLPKPVTSQTIWGPVMALGTLSFRVANNTVESSTGTVIIVYTQGD